MRFYEGHSKLLQIYFGITKITSGNVDWINHRNTAVVIVEDDTRHQNPIWAARGCRWRMCAPLPIETAIGKV